MGNLRYRRALNSNLLISRKWRYLSPFLVKIHVEIIPYKTARYEPPEGAKRLLIVSMEMGRGERVIARAHAFARNSQL